jgi:hypothetical protein
MTVFPAWLRQRIRGNHLWTLRLGLERGNARTGSQPFVEGSGYVDHRYLWSCLVLDMKAVE